MPQPVKQKPNGQTSRSSSPAGSVLAEAVPVSDLADDYLKMVLYGQNRVGKTTLACQFPKPLLLISFEPGQQGGAKSVKQTPGVKFLRVSSKAKAVTLAKELKDSDGGICDLPGYIGKRYQTHVLDTCTSLQDVILRELMGLEDAPVQLNWGSVSQEFYRDRSEQAKEVMRLYRDLPANTVFIAQEKDHNPPKEERNKLLRGLQTESFFAADMGGATVKWMHDACDYIGQLYIAKEVKTTTRTAKILGKDKQITETEETGRLVRRLRTMYHPNYAAGFRSSNPERVPEFIEAGSPQEMYEKIMAVINGED